MKTKMFKKGEYRYFRTLASLAKVVGTKQSWADKIKKHPDLFEKVEINKKRWFKTKLNDVEINTLFGRRAKKNIKIFRKNKKTHIPKLKSLPLIIGKQTTWAEKIKKHPDLFVKEKGFYRTTPLTIRQLHLFYVGLYS